MSEVDDYIRSFPADVQEVLERVRQTIKDAVPHGGEKISYDIPTITVDGSPLLYFAGWKQHISVYPIPTGDEKFQQELEPYVAGKGTLKFPLNQPIPYDLIARVAANHLKQRASPSEIAIQTNESRPPRPLR